MTLKNKLTALIRFSFVIFNPFVMLGYTLFLFLGFSGFILLVFNADTTYIFNYKLFLAIASFFIILFYLRVIDEIKDLHYDKEHNPVRPLVAGVVTFRDLYLFIVLSVAAVITLNIFISMYTLIVAIAILAYGAPLLLIEKISPAI